MKNPMVPVVLSIVLFLSGCALSRSAEARQQARAKVESERLEKRWTERDAKVKAAAAKFAALSNQASAPAKEIEEQAPAAGAIRPAKQLRLTQSDIPQTDERSGVSEVSWNRTQQEPTDSQSSSWERAAEEQAHDAKVAAWKAKNAQEIADYQRKQELAELRDATRKQELKAALDEVDADAWRKGRGLVDWKLKDRIKKELQAIWKIEDDYEANTGRPFPQVEIAENGDIRGADNDGDGRPEPVYVRGYTKEDGTYVRSHFSASPRR